MPIIITKANSFISKKIVRTHIRSFMLSKNSRCFLALSLVYNHSKGSCEVISEKKENSLDKTIDLNTMNLIMNDIKDMLVMENSKMNSDHYIKKNGSKCVFETVFWSSFTIGLN